MAHYLYSELSNIVQAIRNCAGHIEPSREYWRDMGERHRERIKGYMRSHMPHGSGFNAGPNAAVHFDFDESHADKLVMFTEFQHMNSDGFYDGWTEHTITVTPSLMDRIRIRISGRNRNDIKEHIHECFYDALTKDIEPELEAERKQARAKRTIARLYKREREIGNTASVAYRNAKTRALWAEYECGEHNKPELGSVRLQILPDENADFDDLCGDTFNPKVNTDIPESKLERELKEFRDKVNNDGVWGMVGEYWNGTEWEQADSVWGFVGDGWKDSGYDIDVMQQTLDASSEYIKTRKDAA